VRPPRLPPAPDQEGRCRATQQRPPPHPGPPCWEPGVSPFLSPDDPVGQGRVRSCCAF